MVQIKTNGLGKKSLVENCQKIEINSYVRQVKRQLKETMLYTTLEYDGNYVELTTTSTRFKGDRFWFKCPECNKRTGVIYKAPLSPKMACRTCLNLEYRQRARRGMIDVI